MDIAQVVSLVVVLIAALYGLAKFMELIAEKWLHPRCSRLVLVLLLDADVTDAELQVRAAQSTARRLALPLVVDDEELPAETRAIVDVLLKDGGGERMEAFSFEKL
ncbi:MAG: hypothetical protein IKV35_03810 [Clostridia bacterium]|nr:hypothetical protein [Clostridia bacterium]